MENINWYKTLKLYNIDVLNNIPSPPSILFDNKLNTRSFYPIFKKFFRKIFKREYDLFYDILLIQIALQDSSIIKFPSLKVIMRIDDFPHWVYSLDDFKKFWRIIENHRVPVVLGVTPNLDINPLSPLNHATRDLIAEEVSFLGRISENGHQIALHGLTHGVRGNLKAEYVGLTDREIEENVLRGLEKLHRLGIAVDSIIPPFNAFDTNAFRIFEKYFKIVFGGPESIKFFGGYFSPAFLGNVLYIASYHRVYGKAKDLLISFRKYSHLLQQAWTLYIPITIHWSWELEDNFSSFDKLLWFLRDNFSSKFILPLSI